MGRLDEDSVDGVPGLFTLKYSTHVGSTDVGSATYFSYISSTSQSFAPKSCADTGEPLLGVDKAQAYRQCVHAMNAKIRSTARD